MTNESTTAQSRKSQDANATDERKNNAFKGTLNLPKTKFPMRANLVQNEPASIKRWSQANLYERIREARSDSNNPANRGPWSFHDGPPYANGTIHLGHLLNKVLKDFVVRSRTMMGFDVPYVPGWDCHGLPIEHKVMSELHDNGKIEKLLALDDDTRRIAIRRECEKSAHRYIKLQRGQMEQLLTIADYDHPYLTMLPEYEAGVLEVFSHMVGNELVYRDLKPVHWSIENRTALADAELEYYDREDVSIYVHFDVEDPAKLAAAFNVDSSTCAAASFMIWTTTPWTLPANLAVAVHPKYTYVLTKLGDRTVVLARELAELVAKIGSHEVHEPEFLGECNGEQLLSLTYRHPFCDRISPVVAADYVTLEDGTGLVHTAPGHGVEDYQTGLREGLDIYCPVREDGTFDDTAPDWLKGKSVWEGNNLVLEKLKSTGHLYHSNLFAHSYPHDWRGKTPVIFRATEQWFVNVNKPFGPEMKSLKERALEVAANSVEFHPEWGRNRMRGMLETRPDWCLSRQRSWGLPIPVFFDANNSKNVLATEQSVMAVAYNIQKHGSGYWFTSSPTELLDGYDPNNDPQAPPWLRDQLKDEPNATLVDLALQKSQDIFDVWFESGSSWNPVMRGRNMGYPVELYLEGSDQHRGWFQLSLLCGLGATGVSPFKSLLTHGFIVDAEGGKMSKSVGNTIEVDDLLKRYGADVARWWVAAQNFENDIKAGYELFDVAGESYRKVRNTLRFLLSNLFDFQPTTADHPNGHGVDLNTLPPTSLEAWVLGEYNHLAAVVLCAYQRYDFKGTQTAIYNFCNETLSAVYCAAVKDRLYCDHPDSPRRRRTQSIMFELVDGLSRLLAPILPHTADEAFRALHAVEAKDDPRCVHLVEFIEVFEGVTVDPDWPVVMAARDRALQSLEKARNENIVDNPLDAEVCVHDPDGKLQNFARRFAEQLDHDDGDDFLVDFADLLGVSRVRIVNDTPEAEVISLENEPRCERSWKRDGTVKERSNGFLLSERDAQVIGVK